MHTDHQGSVVAVSSAAGTLAAANSYDEWGIPASANVGRFQYTGQAWLAEIGLYHYKARIYSPTLGRFLQTDPVGYDDQINLYAYVANDPVNQTDPTGMYADLAIETVSIGLGVNSFFDNVSTGNFGAAAVDAIGVVADTVLAVVPVAPGAAGIGIKAAREAGEAAGKAAKSAAAAAERAKNVEKGIPSSKLGPSGKPKVHNVQHSTTKGAKEAAQKQAPKDGSARFDAHPQDGNKPHYQAQDAKGENVKPVVHHCIPGKSC